MNKMQTVLPYCISVPSTSETMCEVSPSQILKGIGAKRADGTRPVKSLYSDVQVEKV